MKPEDYKHTWVLPRKAWYVRLYLWLWEGDPQEITFCKLWWGYVLFWLGLIFKALVTLTRINAALVSATAKVLRADQAAKAAERQAEKLARLPRVEITRRAVVGRPVTLRCEEGVPFAWEVGGREYTFETPFGPKPFPARGFDHVFHEPGEHPVKLTAVANDKRRRTTEQTVQVYEHPALPLRTLEAIADGVSRASMKLRALDPYAMKIFQVIGACGLVLGVAGVMYEAYVVTPAVASWLAQAATNTTQFVGSVVPAALHAVPQAAQAGGHFVAQEVPKLGWLGVVGAILIAFLAVGLYCGFILALLMAFRSVIAEPLAAGTKKGSLGFVTMMRMGYKAVKSNTCPRVVVEDEEEEALSRDTESQDTARSVGVISSEPAGPKTIVVQNLSVQFKSPRRRE